MRKYRTSRLVFSGILAAVLFVSQVALSFLPNIEIVSFFIILYTMILGKKVFPIIYVFVLLEGIFYGFGIWWINYLYIWSVLACIVLIFRKQKSFVFWSIISGFFGLAFGLLCSAAYLFAGGVNAALSYWISGIPFDIVHCIGNVCVCLVLFKPMYFVLNKLAAGKF